MTVPRQVGWRRFVLPVLWIAMTIAFGVALSRLPWRRAVEEMARIHTAWFLAAVMMNFAILPLWALEWRLLVPAAFRVTRRKMFGVVAITASVLNSIPMLAGEVSAVALLVSHGGLTRGAALSVLTMDQLLVALAKVAVLVTAAIVAPVPDWLRGGMLSLSAVLGVALIALGLLAHRWHRVHEWMSSRPSALAHRLARVATWGRHLEVLRSARLSLAVSGLALTKKSLEVGAVLAVQTAFGMEPTLAVATLVVAALAISTLVPIAPGNLGVYEATVFAVYRFAGVSAETALGLALVQHLAFLLPSLATGYLILTARQLVPRWRQAA